eukprot:PhM_4_TR561/c0_g1_i1/m.97176
MWGRFGYVVVSPRQLGSAPCRPERLRSIVRNEACFRPAVHIFVRFTRVSISKLLETFIIVRSGNSKMSGSSRWNWLLETSYIRSVVFGRLYAVGQPMARPVPETRITSIFSNGQSTLKSRIGVPSIHSVSKLRVAVVAEVYVSQNRIDSCPFLLLIIFTVFNGIFEKRLPSALISVSAGQDSTCRTSSLGLTTATEANVGLPMITKLRSVLRSSSCSDAVAVCDDNMHDDDDVKDTAIISFRSALHVTPGRSHGWCSRGADHALVHASEPATLKPFVVKTSSSVDRIVSTTSAAPFVTHLIFDVSQGLPVVIHAGSGSVTPCTCETSTTTSDDSAHSADHALGTGPINVVPLTLISSHAGLAAPQHAGSSPVFPVPLRSSTRI